MEAKKVVAPSARSIWSSLGLVILVVFSCLWFWKYIPELSILFTKELNLNTTDLNHIVSVTTGLTTGALLIAGIVCLAVNIFNPLKSLKEEGLVSELILGFIGGVILMLIVGAIVGIIPGLIMGISAGLISGIAGGLVKEFK